MSIESRPLTEVRPSINLDNRVIVLMGAEGSGKSILGKKLAQKSGKPLLSVGDILRDLAANDRGDYGDIAREMFASKRYFMNRQKLLDIYTQRFQRENLADGFILDGALRDTIETRGFQTSLERAGLQLPVTAVFLRIPGWLAIERLSADPTARGRSDDDPESVIRRLSNFYDHLGERVSIIKNDPNWQFIQIDGKPPSDEVYQNAIELLTSGK